MSITDELRAWFEDHMFKANGWQEVYAIADRIDAEHEESIQREHESAYDAGYADGMGVANKADMRAEYLRGKNDGYDEGWDAAAKTMTEHMVELPKDADGEYIHVGDVMEERSGHTFEAASLMAFGGSDNWLVFSDARNFSSFREPHDLRHHHAPTVEDVLREFADEVYADADNEIRGRDFLCAKYAKRLTLAKGEDA